MKFVELFHMKQATQEIFTKYIPHLDSTPKTFDNNKMLGFYKSTKGFVYLKKFIIMFHQTIPTIASMIINKRNIILRPSFCGNGKRPPYIRMN